MLLFQFGKKTKRSTHSSSFRPKTKTPLKCEICGWQKISHSCFVFGIPEPCLLLQHTAYNTTCLYLICATYGFWIFGPSRCVYCTIQLMEEIQLTCWYGESTIMYRVLYMSGGWPDFFHQQYLQQMCKNIPQSSNPPSCFYRKVMKIYLVTLVSPDSPAILLK